MIIVDGNKIAKNIIGELKNEFKKIDSNVYLAIISVGEDDSKKSFILQKERVAKEIGVGVKIYKVSEPISNRKLRKKIVEISKISKNKGIIVQLPLPAYLDIPRILNAIPADKDVDVLTEKNLAKFLNNRLEILPPSVLAIKRIFDDYEIEIKDKNIVVVGFGRLIGRPISLFLLNQKATVSIINENTKNFSDFVRSADILISGAGKPFLITKDMVKNNSVIIDFGFSKKNGKIIGDVDFEGVKEKASLITPVPGGMGPIVVAMMFKNFLSLLKVK